MDLRWSPAEEAFRGEVRGWLEANVPRGLPSGDTRAGFAAHLAWERALHAARWAVVSWPREYGGRAATLWERLIFEEEYYRAGAPQRVTQNGIFLLAPALFEFGMPEQRDRYLPRMAAAADLWRQGWSEPDAGSDLAAVRSSAVRDTAGGGWRLSGRFTASADLLLDLYRERPSAALRDQVVQSWIEAQAYQMFTLQQIEEVGRSGLPGPTVETIAVAAPLLPRPDILAGDTLVAVRHGDTIPFGQAAGLIVMREGGTMLSFGRNDLDLIPQAAVDGSRMLARTVPAAGPAHGATVLTEDPAVTEAAWQRGVLGTSALLIGLARRMLDLTVGYVKRREQFGVPVGSFQAVKHAPAWGDPAAHRALIADSLGVADG